MSKYTTEVRFICESYSGLSESVGLSKTAEIIEKARPLIFDFDYPIFDGEYRKTLETKILKHYYTQEIGFEVVGLWKLYLDEKLNLIMPYYNQLYQSALLKIEPLINIKNETTHNETANENNSQQNTANDSSTENETNNQTVTDTKTSNSTESGTNTGSTNSENDNWTLSSDTPQGGLEGIKSMEYLTNATENKGTSSVNVNGSESSSSESSENGKNILVGERNKRGSKGSTFNSTASRNNALEYLTNNKGISGVSESELLMKYRETFLNIDKMIINDLSDLFMSVW